MNGLTLSDLKRVTLEEDLGKRKQRAQTSVTSGQEIHGPRLLDYAALLGEVTLALETPVQAADDPVLETLDVLRDVAVDLPAVIERRQAF